MNKNKQIIIKYQEILLSVVILLGTPAVIAFAQAGDTLVANLTDGRSQQLEQQLHSAKQLVATDRLAEAEAQLNQIIARQPNWVEAYLLRATLRKKQSNLMGAVTDYSSAIHLQPDYSEARFGRAQVRYELQQYDAAREDFEYLLDQNGGITNEVFYRGGIQQGEFVASSVTTLQSSMKSDWLNYIGLCYYHTQNYSQAEQYFHEAVAHAPQDPMGHVNLGLTYEVTHDTLRAIYTYQRALEIAPAHAVAQRNLLSLARQRNDTTLERQTLANTADDLSYDSYFQRGLSYLQRDEYALAIQHFDQALALEPYRTEALLQRGFAHEKVLRLPAALSDYTMAIRLDPSAEKAYSNRANVYFRQEKYWQAIGDYNRVLSINPDNATVWLNRGLTYHRLGKRKEACQDLQKARTMGSTAAANPIAKLCLD